VVDPGIVEVLLHYRTTVVRAAPGLAASQQLINQAVEQAQGCASPEDLLVLEAFRASIDTFMEAVQAHVDSVRALCARVNGETH
jgi:phage tail protein X